MLIFLLLIASVAVCRGQECSSDQVPDLNGAWVCDDVWLVDTKKGVGETDYLKKWFLYFELPKFYAVSKIRTIPTCSSTDPLLHLAPAVWDERYDKKENEDLADAPDFSWTLFDIKDVDFVANTSQEYSGFARRAPYWRLEIDTFDISEECMPKFMFFAKAGVAAMQHYVMELDFVPRMQYEYMTVDAPIENTCNKVTGVPSAVVARYRLDTSFYRKYTSAYGIPVMSSSVVDDRALQRACYVVRFMLADRKDLRDHMYTNKGRVAIIGRRETVPMVPEMRQYTWWTRRAAGGTFHNPVNVGAEENMLCERGDGYARNQDIFMHEFAHGVHLIACHTALPNFNSRLQQSFNSARYRGLWTNTYANTDNREYFAEGVQAYFEQQREGPVGGDGIQNHIDTREELKRHDPNLYKIIDELFPCYNDYIPRCDDIGQSRGLNQNFKLNCKGGGGTTLRPGTTSTTQPGSCTDDNGSCAYWAGIGECDKNPDYMLVNCKKSCSVCPKPTTKTPDTTLPTNTTTEQTPTTTTVDTSTTVSATSTKTTTTDTTTQGSCQDNRVHCGYWASVGECNRNPGYMKTNCKKSCGECSGSTCVDSDANCMYWKSYCSFNQYVIKNCKKMCDLC